MQSLKKKIQKASSSREDSSTETLSDSADTTTEAARRKLATMFFRTDKKKRDKNGSDPSFSFAPTDSETEGDVGAAPTGPRGRPAGRTKTPSLGRLRPRARGHTQLSDESPHSLAHSGSPSISTLASAALKPFPLIRSQSSLSGTPGQQPRRSDDYKPRRKTESEAMMADSESDRRNTVSSDSRKPKSTASRTPSIYVAPQSELELPLPPQDSESVSEYLDLLQELGFGSTVCSRLSHEPGDFMQECLQAYMFKFSFEDEPIDMSLRKLLMFQRLPREAQQIERVLQAFSATYHSQNPQLFETAEQVHFIVFSMVILHTDTFNKNVKHKMNKSSYIRSGYCEGVPLEVLDYIYDNITYTQFIHTDDDNVLSQLFDAAPAELHTVGSSTASIASSTQNVPPRRTSFGWSKDLFDPYMLILEGRLASLRPTSLVKVLSASDPYLPCALVSPSEILGLRSRFVSGPTIQLVSERSRPDAYTGVAAGAGAELKAEELLLLTSPGVVDIQVVKMGIVERRESSKKMLYSSRSIWREWGAILTESQLYLFKNASWVRGLLAESSASADPAVAVTRTALEGFNATFTLSTKDMAALRYEPASAEEDKHVFLLRAGNGTQIWLAASDENEREDWIRCIDFAATFSTHPVQLIPSMFPEHSASTSAVSSPANPSPTAGFYRSASDTSLTSAAVLQAQRARTHELLHQISDLDQKLLALQSEIVAQERDCRHLMVLAPIQQKTRDALAFAAGQYASKSDWFWVDRARYRSYRNILEMDLRLVETRWLGRREPDCNVPHMAGVKEESLSTISTLSGRPDGGADKLAETLTENSSQEFGEGSLVRGREAFEVRGHRFSLVDVNPEIFGKPSASNLGSE